MERRNHISGQTGTTGSSPVLTTMKNETNDWKQGLSNGHIAQIVRRKNVVRVVESKKKYNRKKLKENFEV